MHNARQPATDRQQNIQPEMQAEADLKEHTERRQDEGEQNADNVQQVFSDRERLADNVLEEG